MDLILGRRSIRKYDESHKIPRDELNEILMNAMKAPSSKNMQPWRFLVIDTAEGKNKLAPARRGWAARGRNRHRRCSGRSRRHR